MPAAVIGQPLPAHEFTGLPKTALLKKVPPELTAEAKNTSVALVVNSGAESVPPLPCPEVGKVQVARVVGVAQVEGGSALGVMTTRVSLPTLPVSTVELMIRLEVVLV